MEFKKGDTVELTGPKFSKHIGKKGKIVGFSTDGKCCWVLVDGLKTTSSYHKNFLRFVDTEMIIHDEKAVGPIKNLEMAIDLINIYMGDEEYAVFLHDSVAALCNLAVEKLSDRSPFSGRTRVSHINR